ncbi:uncharacterized protein LOC144576556 isoform X1 [Callithrix jacchus]
MKDIRVQEETWHHVIQRWGFTMLTRMVSIFCPRDPTASSQALQAHFEPSDDLDRPSSFLPVASAGLAFASQLWHEAERGLPAGDALGVLGPDLHLHQEERIEAGLHRCHHPPERGLSGARVPRHPPVTHQRVQVCPGVGHHHQVQSTAGGSDPHHGA